MLDDNSPEGRLRELLLDPGWSLPPWPDAQARIRRAARRQRVRAAGLAACTGAIAAAAVAVPLALSGGSPGTTPGEGLATPAAAGHASATPSGQGHVATVLIPDVLGLKLPEAKALLRSVLLPRADIIVRYVKASQPAGVVIAQTPAPGVRVAVNGRITLQVPSAS
jgi:hypothetical protein